MSTDIVASVLFALVESYQSEALPESAESKQEKVIGRNLPKSSKEKQAEKSKHIVAKRVAEPNNEDKATVSGMSLPEKGSLGAKGFLLAMRGAKSRDEQICLIAAYVGFDPRADFGGQEIAARMQAQRELRGAPIALKAPYSRRGVQVEGTAFAPELPNAVSDRVRHLEARERLAAENLATHRNNMRNLKERSLSQRQQDYVLMQLEEERLSQIRNDLASLGALSN